MLHDHRDLLSHRWFILLNILAIFSFGKHDRCQDVRCSEGYLYFLGNMVDVEMSAEEERNPGNPLNHEEGNSRGGEI